MNQINRASAAELLNSIAGKYGQPSMPTPVKPETSQPSDILGSIKQRYAKPSR